MTVTPLDGGPERYLPVVFVEISAGETDDMIVVTGLTAGTGRRYIVCPGGIPDSPKMPGPRFGWQQTTEATRVGLRFRREDTPFQDTLGIRFAFQNPRPT